MPRKTPRSKKKARVNDQSDSGDQQTPRVDREDVPLTRLRARQLAELRMNQNNRALLLELVQDDQQRPVQQPVRMTLGDYTAPRVLGFQSVIAPPGINNNNWELKTGLIQMVQNNQISGRMNEDPSPAP
ncbi:unnamed protein product [Rhodiola kirilowii]